MSGFFDRDGDGRSDYVVFRHAGSDANGTLHMKRSASGACNGTTWTLTVTGSRLWSRVFGVADMTGDGQDDLVVNNPYSMSYRVIGSSHYDAVTTTHWLSLAGAELH